MTAQAIPVVTPIRRLGFMAMVVGMFLAILDIQIVASSSAEIGAGVGAGPEQLAWVQTSYLIAEVIMIPLSGWLARGLSTRILFVASSIGFTLASALCAFAWDLPSMIVFRALQGFLGGAMIPTVFTVSFTMFPPSSRAAVSVAVGLVATAAPTLGPALGGWITQILSWHWLFLVNLAPGMIVALIVAVTIDIDEPDYTLFKQIDFWGIFLTGAFLGCLQYVLEEGPRNDWLADGHVRLYAAISAAAAVFFLWHGLTHANRVIDLTAFKDRNFTVGCAFSFVMGAGLYGSVFLLPQFLARVRGMDALTVGIVMMVIGLFQWISAPIAGLLSKKLDLRVMLGMGISLFGLGLVMTGTLTSETGMHELNLPNAIRGISLMLCFLPINALALGTLPQAQLKNASGLYNLMRNLGGAVGLALINTWVNDRLVFHRTHLIEKVTIANPALESYQNGLGEILGPRLGEAADAGTLAMLARLVEREALAQAFSDGFIALGLAFWVALLLMPLVRKVSMGGSGDTGH